MLKSVFPLLYLLSLLSYLSLSLQVSCFLPLFARMWKPVYFFSFLRLFLPDAWLLFLLFQQVLLLFFHFSYLPFPALYAALLHISVPVLMLSFPFWLSSFWVCGHLFVFPVLHNLLPSVLCVTFRLLDFLHLAVVLKLPAHLPYPASNHPDINCPPTVLATLSCFFFLTRSLPPFFLTILCFFSYIFST